MGLMPSLRVTDHRFGGDPQHDSDSPFTRSIENASHFPHKLSNIIYLLLFEVGDRIALAL